MVSDAEFEFGLENAIRGLRPLLAQQPAASPKKRAQATAH
jgi:hypothetical protein